MKLTGLFRLMVLGVVGICMMPNGIPAAQQSSPDIQIQLGGLQLQLGMAQDEVLRSSFSGFGLTRSTVDTLDP